MDLAAAEKMAKRLMIAHGVNNYNFKWDRAIRRNGQTDFYNKTVSLSAPRTKERSEDAVRNTVLHEIAHVLAGPRENHGPAWQTICIRIGGDGKRCGEDKVVVAHKYEVRCINHGLMRKMHRRPKGGVDSYLSRFSCRRCGRGSQTLKFVSV